MKNAYDNRRIYKGFQKCYNTVYEEFFMAKSTKTAIDSLDWIVRLILTIFFDPVIMGINRVMRGKVIIGVIWLITGGLFGIGWLIDIITMMINKDITILA